MSEDGEAPDNLNARTMTMVTIAIMEGGEEEEEEETKEEEENGCKGEGGRAGDRASVKSHQQMQLSLCFGVVAISCLE